MNRVSLWPGLLLVLLGGTALAVGGLDPAPGPAADHAATAQPAYVSHYLVFGTRDASGTPRMLALDFNRTEHDDGRVAYEYKLFVGRGADWSMPVYETWTTAPDAEAPRFPARGGLNPTLTDDGILQVTADLPDLALEVRPGPSAFPFPEDDENGTNRTGHPEFVVRWNGETYRGAGVYERIRPGGAATSPEAAAERERKLDAGASFGLYDWIVLYDDEGRLWHVSQGTLTADFAYQQATGALPGQTRDVLVRWTATAYDKRAQQHRPTAWLVDVPAWRMRVRLQRQGEHRGHGSPRDDGTRPVYVQAGVEGRGLLQGEAHQFFGMVELIRD
ncbi:hypothetical protein [Salinibacter altiplanensis]|uniref:hypothetical protein n=1 Tax=Salinibacter altiplanensis TaxID=1803181 RepID=UPI000C9FF2E0|nr:hypothetical protein [Salinibacter altiplanensis]